MCCTLTASLVFTTGTSTTYVSSNHPISSRIHQKYNNKSQFCCTPTNPAGAKLPELSELMVLLILTPLFMISWRASIIHNILRQQNLLLWNSKADCVSEDQQSAATKVLHGSFWNHPFSYFGITSLLVRGGLDAFVVNSVRLSSFLSFFFSQVKIIAVSQCVDGWCWYWFFVLCVGVCRLSLKIVDTVIVDLGPVFLSSMMKGTLIGLTIGEHIGLNICA